MKKLLTLLLIAPFIFSACGDDDEEKKTYFNPVEGEWVYTLDENNSMTRIFTKEFESYSDFIDNGMAGERHEWGTYQITSTLMIYKSSTHEYKIEKDTLWFWVKGKEADWNKKYIRKK